MTPPRATRGRLVGVLGGSFDPAHAGHLHISRDALIRYRLDAIWWIVAPRNPLKSGASRSFERRFEQAERVAAADPRILVSDFERNRPHSYTAETLERLALDPDRRFVWLMGADNLAELHRWRRWRRIFELAPIAVFDRAPFAFRALASPAASQFARHRLDDRDALDLARAQPPAWHFARQPLHAASSSQIRAAEARAEEKTISANHPSEEDAEDATAKRPAPSLSSAALRDLALASLDADKAIEPICIDLAGKTEFADFMIVATGTSQRHVSAMAENLIERLKKRGVRGVAAEGQNDSDWVLLDLTDVIVHLFRAETRALYDIERLWSAPPPGGPRSRRAPDDDGAT